MRTEKEIFDLILKIANEDERIRAVYMHGSRANPKSEKDIYSDYDITFVVTETDSFINDKNWINSFGDIAVVHESNWTEAQFGLNVGTIDFSRRYVWCMLFTDGNRIDLIIEIIEEAMNHKHIKGKPMTVLLDKDGCLPEISPPSNEINIIEKPTEDKYTACCTAFWWFLNDVAKTIARDQLPYAKEQFRVYIRYTLNIWSTGISAYKLIFLFQQEKTVSIIKNSYPQNFMIYMQKRILTVTT